MPPLSTFPNKPRLSRGSPWRVGRAPRSALKLGRPGPAAHPAPADQLCRPAGGRQLIPRRGGQELSSSKPGVSGGGSGHGPIGGRGTHQSTVWGGGRSFLWLLPLPQRKAARSSSRCISKGGFLVVVVGAGNPPPPGGCESQHLAAGGGQLQNHPPAPRQLDHVGRRGRHCRVPGVSDSLVRMVVKLLIASHWLRTRAGDGGLTPTGRSVTGLCNFSHFIPRSWEGKFRLEGPGAWSPHCLALGVGISALTCDSSSADPAGSAALCRGPCV